MTYKLLIDKHPRLTALRLHFMHKAVLHPKAYHLLLNISNNQGNQPITPISEIVLLPLVHYCFNPFLFNIGLPCSLRKAENIHNPITEKKDSQLCQHNIIVIF